MNKKTKTLASQCMIVEKEWTNKILSLSSLHCQRDEVTLFIFIFPLCFLVRMMKQSPRHLIHSLVVGKKQENNTDLDAMTKEWNEDF